MGSNFCNVGFAFEKFQFGYTHTIIVSKLNDIHMKGKHEEILTNFFNGIAKEEGDDFSSKITGYCLVYAPYYICMLESDDCEYL